MPTYKNRNGSPKNIGSQSINAGEIKKVLSWPAGDTAGIEMLDEMPMYNPTIYSERITESKTVHIPEGEARFAIHFFAEVGAPIIHYNSKDNKPCLKLYPGAKWNERTYERLIDKLIVELKADEILWIIIERT